MKLHVGHLEKAGITTGFLFTTRPGDKSTLSDFEDDFFEPLLDIQASKTLNLIDKKMDVRSEFGLWRSLRKGVTAHALNMGVPPELINAINRWRDERSRRGQPSRMIDVRANIEAIVPTAVRYSFSL